MAFVFKTDQEPKQLVDNKTTLSVNEPTIVEENLTQEIFAEGEEERLVGKGEKTTHRGREGIQIQAEDGTRKADQVCHAYPSVHVPN